MKNEDQAKIEALIRDLVEQKKMPSGPPADRKKLLQSQKVKLSEKRTA